MQLTDELLTAIEHVERVGQLIRYRAMISEAALFEDLHTLEEAVNQIHDELAKKAECSTE